MRRLRPIVIVLCLLAVCRAQPTTAPATQPEWQLTITGVEGVSQARSATDQPWVKLEVGMKLSKGSEIRNGVRSAVKGTIYPDREVILDRLGIYKVDPDLLEAKPATGPMRMVPSSTLWIRTGPVYLDEPPFPVNSLDTRLKRRPTTVP